MNRPITLREAEDLANNAKTYEEFERRWKAVEDLGKWLAKSKSDAIKRKLSHLGKTEEE